MSKKELADLLGLDNASKISAWEKGVYQPSDEMIEKMSGVLGFSLDEVTAGAVESAPEPEKTGLSQEEIKQIVKEVCDRERENLYALIQRFLTSSEIPPEIVFLARKIVEQHPVSCPACGNSITIAPPPGNNRAKGVRQ